eukprot:CAMPEP_0183550608 /NCGR_PEP_ID=MMETSP0371-20130417/65355_1 /TAXON_ID=268820 /ORGANISM="Peridinium aciculiferum, Strain PAER-2" /LENGTH=43 /DNA_ID= /DNA_START= /DNA_END= /DNA_ORIENTATION=
MPLDSLVDPAVPYAAALLRAAAHAYASSRMSWALPPHMLLGLQ